METNETLAKYLSYIHAAEKLLHHAAKQQLENDDLGHFPEAKTLIMRIHTVTSAHLQAVESAIKNYGGESRSAFKDTITTAAGAVLGVIGHSRTHNVSKFLRDDYASLSLNTIGYSQLYTTALALVQPLVASMSLTHLKDNAKLIIEISQAVIPVVVEELKETNVIDPTVAATAALNVRKAWQEA